jgi:hypothetical protein
MIVRPALTGTTSVSPELTVGSCWTPTLVMMSADPARSSDVRVDGSVMARMFSFAGCGVPRQ